MLCIRYGPFRPYVLSLKIDPALAAAGISLSLGDFVAGPKQAAEKRAEATSAAQDDADSTAKVEHPRCQDALHIGDGSDLLLTTSF